MIAFSAQPRPGQKVVPNILVTYDRLPPAKTLATFVDEQEGELARGAKRYTLLGRREVTLDGRSGEEILFRWDAGSGLLRQRQLYFALGDGRVITVVNTALDAEFDNADVTFGATLHGFKWL